MVDDTASQQYGAQNTTGNSSFSRGLETSAIKYRLDNEPALAKLELYLRSSIVVGKQVGDEYVEEVVQVAKPLANEAGVQGIMGYMHLTIGAHNVQGNTDWNRYDALIFEIDEYLSRIVFANRVEWGITVNTVDLVLDAMMTTVQLFFSRTVDNQERLSYGQSMMTKEMSVVNAPESKWSLKGLLGMK